MCERYSRIWGMDPISADPAHWEAFARDSQKTYFVHLFPCVCVCVCVCVLCVLIHVCVPSCVWCEWVLEKDSSEKTVETECVRVCVSVCVCVCVCVRERERERERYCWESDGKYVCPVHTDLFVWECINIYVGWKGGWICKTVGTKANNSGAAVKKDGTFPWLLWKPNRFL